MSVSVSVWARSRGSHGTPFADLPTCTLRLSHCLQVRGLAGSTTCRRPPCRGPRRQRSRQGTRVSNSRTTPKGTVAGGMWSGHVVVPREARFRGTRATQGALRVNPRWATRLTLWMDRQVPWLCDPASRRVCSSRLVRLTDRGGGFTRPSPPRRLRVTRPSVLRAADLAVLRLAAAP